MATQVQSVRAAVVQAAPVAFDRERTLEKVRTLTAGATSQGVQEECLLTAELDLADTVRGKFDFDVVGHYARPDIFSLHVNEHPQSPVIHN